MDDIPIRHRIAALRAKLNVILDFVQQEFSILKNELWVIEGNFVYQEYQQQLQREHKFRSEPQLVQLPQSNQVDIDEDTVFSLDDMLSQSKLRK